MLVTDKLNVMSKVKLEDIQVNSENKSTFAIKIKYIWKVLTSKQTILITKNGDDIKLYYDKFSLKGTGMLLKELGTQMSDCEIGLDDAREILKNNK